METRAITFRKLKEVCGNKYDDFVYPQRIYYCSENGNYKEDAVCNSKNCPVWRKLKKEG